MFQGKLHEVVFSTDRRLAPARAVSPVDIRRGIDTKAYGKVVILHPGWGKAPERHAKFLLQLADNGFLPIGVDTRYGYCDQQLLKPPKLIQPRIVSTTNPYFFVSGHSENRWRYRRPTVLLNICEMLGITERAYIGHSEGGRIAALASLAQPEVSERLIIVNGAGTGGSSRGGKRLTISNANNARALFSNRTDLLPAAQSALGSMAYAMTHLRRTWSEKEVIQSTDTWTILDELKGHNMPVHVLHARDDELISFEDSEMRAQQRPWVEFLPTSGNHSNVYEQGVRDLIINTLQKD